MIGKTSTIDKIEASASKQRGGFQVPPNDPGRPAATNRTRVQRLRFQRNGIVKLSNYGPDPIGRIEHRQGISGKYHWEWKPNISAPARLQIETGQRLRLGDVKRALLQANHSTKPPD